MLRKAIHRGLTRPVPDPACACNLQEPNKEIRDVLNAPKLRVGATVTVIGAGALQVGTT
jgi:hypothetical protein